MAKLVLTLPALYKDNSLHNETSKKERIIQRYNKLETQLQKTEISRRKIGLLVKNEENKKQLINKIKQDIVARTILNEKMDEAATVIQRKTKELKQHREKNDVMLSYLENTISNNQEYLDSSIYYIFWNLGNAPTDSSNKIKKAYLRSKFRMKIERIKKVYKILTKNKKTMCRIVIRSSLRNFSCKIKIQNSGITKENKIQTDKLLKIRQNLAQLSVKLFWQRNHMTFRKFIYKCKKFKRSLLRKTHNQFLSTDFPISSGLSSYISTPANEEVAISTIDNIADQEAARLALLKLLREKQEKLNSSLISYNVIKPKGVIVSPLKLLSIDEKSIPRPIRIHQTRNSIGHSSKTIGYSSHALGQSNGSLSTRSASNRHRIFKL